MTTTFLADIYSVSSNYAYTTHDSGKAKDNEGNVYASCVYGTTGNIKYFLDGNYDIFTGTVYVGHYVREHDMDTSGATIYIYGDDSLLATFSSTNNADAPFEFSVEVSGVDHLNINFVNCFANGWGYPKFAIGNPRLISGVNPAM